MQEGLHPLIVCDESGRFLFLAYTDKNGYDRSLKQGTLWAVQTESDHLLPNGNEAVLQRIEDRGSYYYAEVSISTYFPEQSIEQGSRSSTPALEKETPSLAPSVPVEVNLQLTTLLQLIKERNMKRPSESYTGQLFNAGIEKIRKKLGEEAVELILARNREDTIVEAADLLYHLLVFLEAENIGFSQVLEELNHRQ